MRRATRTAAASPSSANGTSFSEGCEPRTNVIRGCTEATAAPRLRNEASSSLPSAPLECNATLPFHSICFEIDSAAAAIAESGTQNQTNSACTEDKSLPSRAPTCSASLCALVNDPARDREITTSMAYPATCSECASADPRFPAPTIATRGFPAMPGSIAERTQPLGRSPLCPATNVQVEAESFSPKTQDLIPNT